MVFSLSPQTEASKKKIIRNRQRANELLFEQLTDETRLLAKTIKLDLIWINEQKQAGNSFGEKYGNALQATFDLGYDNIVSIGNDCPDLSSQLIEQAVEKLSGKQVVCGPAADGGIYLLALNRSQFDLVTFKQLPWKKNYLCKSLRQYFDKQHSEIYKLPILNDLDSINSLQRFAAKNPFSALAQFYQRLFANDTKITKPFLRILVSDIFAPLHYLRGPPCPNSSS